jgi:hypothetical protein
VSRDDLRALLEKFAATAGDPPEHGLDGVAARWRRRTRHRRGAVATAVALAVLGIAVSPRLSRLGGDDHDVTAAETGTPARPSEIPDVVELKCTPGGIDVPVASIRPQDDGLHVRVENTLPYTTKVWVQSDDDWDSGRIDIAPGQPRTLVQPVPPGGLTLGCRIGDTDQQRSVELVDVFEIYRAPELDCGDDQPLTASNLPVGSASSSQIAATTGALRTWGVTANFDIEPVGGYPEPRYAEQTVDPTVAVVLDGDTLGWAHLAGATPTPGEPARAPWTTVTSLRYCPSLLASGSPAGGSGSTTTSTAP